MNKSDKSVNNIWFNHNDIELKNNIELENIEGYVLPLILSYYLIKNKHKYALINLLIIIIIYVIYMNYIDRNIYNTYLINKPPLNWKEYFELCKSKEGKYIPCIFN